jgi:hypothetical protein
MHFIIKGKTDMNIQSGYGASAYQGVSKINLPQAGEIPKKSALIDSSGATNSTSSADQVTISAAAMELAAKANNTTQIRTPAQEALLKSASSDPQSAEKIASDMANTPSTIFFDIRSIGGGDQMNKLSSGRIIDDSFKQQFASESSDIDAKRKAIYNSEKAKGTDPVQILSKMMDFTNMQSKDYLEATSQLG